MAPWFTSVSEGAFRKGLHEIQDYFRMFEERFGGNPFTRFAQCGDGIGHSVLTLFIAFWVADRAAQSPADMSNAVLADVPKSLHAAFKECVGHRAIGLCGLVGHDSDSYGATTGGIIVARLGAFPAEMTQNLKLRIEFLDGKAEC